MAPERGPAPIAAEPVGPLLPKLPPPLTNCGGSPGETTSHLSRSRRLKRQRRLSLSRRPLTLRLRRGGRALAAHCGEGRRVSR